MDIAQLKYVVTELAAATKSVGLALGEPGSTPDAAALDSCRQTICGMMMALEEIDKGLVSFATAAESSP